MGIKSFSNSNSSVFDVKKEIFNYFKSYKLVIQDSFSITLTKIVDQNPKRNNQKQKHFIYIEIKNNVSGLSVNISGQTEAFSAPFTSYDLNENRGSVKLNKFEFYRHLYYQFYPKIILPNTLKDKINDFNSKQTDERKKIIEGRDY